MDKIRIRKLNSSLAKRDYRRMYMNDFFLTWEKTDDEIAATFLVAEILRGLREGKWYQDDQDYAMGHVLIVEASQPTLSQLTMDENQTVLHINP